MDVIENSSLNPYFNLAAEEYLTRRGGDVFMLWRNSPAVIIGRNQNAYAEVNENFLRERNIALVRRLTGGGAVFHDPGNVNFTFITDAAPDREIDFKPFISPIISALAEMGVEAYADGRNDIMCGGMKLSGNAQCTLDTEAGRRLLHHGTLLFCADFGYMTSALRVDPEKLSSKGIKSVAGRVCNIRSLEGYRGSTEPKGFMKQLSLLVAGSAARDLDDGERAEISKLAREKYEKWEWNYGASPAHTQSGKKRFPFGCVEVSLCARGGVIETVKITGDFFGSHPVSELEAALVGVRLEKAALEEALRDCGRYITGAAPEPLAKLFV